MATVEDYCYWPDRNEESIENHNSCICDDEGLHRKDTEWSFVDQDSRRAFEREPKAILPQRGLVECKYARPGPPGKQDVEQLGGSEESDPEDRIQDSTVNMYIASEKHELEGLQEAEGEIPSRGVSHGEWIDQQGDEDSRRIARSSRRQEEDCSEEQALSGTTDSRRVISVTCGTG